MIRALVIALLLGGCMQMQSARVLRPGHTRVSAGLARVGTTDEGMDLPVYFGELRVAYGISDGVELGVQVARTAGLDGNASAAGIAPKFRVYEARDRAVAVSLPALVAWGEQGTRFESGTVAAFPTLLVGFRLEEETELVLSPRVGAFWQPSSSDKKAHYLGGVAVGLSFGAWGNATVQPEVGVTMYEGRNGSAEGAFTFGVGVTGSR